MNSVKKMPPYTIVSFASTICFRTFQEIPINNSPINMETSFFLIDRNQIQGNKQYNDPMAHWEQLCGDKAYRKPPVLCPLLNLIFRETLASWWKEATCYDQINSFCGLASQICMIYGTESITFSFNMCEVESKLMFKNFTN